MLGNPVMEHPIQRGLEILKGASWYRNQVNLQPHGPLGSSADFTLHVPYSTVESKLGEI